MPNVFISYRRSDSAYPAQYIYETLASHFGEESVFLDVDNIPIGVDFHEYLDNAVSKCDVLLTVIGERWLNTTNEVGERRLDDPDDFVRIEIESALSRGIPVIPVLIENATMPKAADLPESLGLLCRRNAAELRPGRDFRKHLDKIVEGIHDTFRHHLLEKGMLDGGIDFDHTIISSDVRIKDAAQYSKSLRGIRPGQAWEANRLKIPFCWCPPGRFTMGGLLDEKVRQKAVEVALTSGFWIGKYPVTQGQWLGLMGITRWSGKKFFKKGDTFPAPYISWQDATNFCSKLTEEERQDGRLPSGWQYILPTEAQWEYACQAGATSRFFFGDDESELGDYAWYKDNTNDIGEEYAHEVGQKKPNAWGLYDVLGNVSEWCLDWYQEDLPGGNDPCVSMGGSNRVYRGGSWYSNSGFCQSGFRYWATPSFRDYYLGFRVALVVTSQANT